MNVLFLCVIYHTRCPPKEAIFMSDLLKCSQDLLELISSNPVIPNICCKHLIGVNASILYRGNKGSHNDLLPAQLHILLWNEFISFKASSNVLLL